MIVVSFIGRVLFGVLIADAAVSALQTYSRGPRDALLVLSVFAVLYVLGSYKSHEQGRKFNG